MSEEEIRLDLEQQRLEKAAAAEMEQTANVIKKTGVFDRVDSLYGEFGGSENAEGGEAAEGGDTGGDDFGGGGSFGGGGDFGADDTGGETVDDFGDAAVEEPAAEAPVENYGKNIDKLLVEQEIQKKRYENKVKKYKNNYTKRLLESLDEKKVVSVSNIDNSKDSLTEDLERMVKSIDDLTNE